VSVYCSALSRFAIPKYALSACAGVPNALPGPARVAQSSMFAALRSSECYKKPELFAHVCHEPEFVAHLGGGSGLHSVKSFDKFAAHPFPAVLGNPSDIGRLARTFFAAAGDCGSENQLSAWLALAQNSH
jgi:hypothetical protein